MTKFNNNQSDNLFSQVFGVAKKLSSTGLNILQQSQIGEVSKLVEPLSNGKTVEGSARNKVRLKWSSMKAHNKCYVNIYLKLLVRYLDAILERSMVSLHLFHLTGMKNIKLFI